MARILIGAIVAVVALGAVAMAVSDGPPSQAPQSSTEFGPTDEAIAAAQQAILAEPKVEDLLYQSGQAVEWQVGVLDNGTSRVGYANYICEVLGENDALKPDTHVRIVDVVRVSRGESFRSASLGHVACADRRVIVP